MNPSKGQPPRFELTLLQFVRCGAILFGLLRRPDLQSIKATGAASASRRIDERQDLGDPLPHLIMVIHL
jgi:hypothetical protein